MEAAKGSVDLLAKRNHHERDDRIIFNEEAHTYHVDGELYTTSVSGIVHSLFSQFNGQEVVEKYFDKWSDDKKSPYYRFIMYCKLNMHMTDEMTKQELIRMWSMFGAERSGAGTAVHLSAELFYNEAPRVDRSPEYEQLMEWHKNDKPKTWECYRMEWSIFDESTKTAGQLDALFRCSETGDFHMVDWKCVEVLESKNSFGERGYEPFSVLHNTNLSHYYVQQSLYAWMLKNCYGITCKSLRLLQLHYSLPAAKEWEVPFLEREVGKVMSARREMAASTKRLRHHVVGDQHTLDANTKKIEYLKELIEVYQKQNAEIMKHLDVV